MVIFILFVENVKWKTMLTRTTTTTDPIARIWTKMWKERLNHPHYLETQKNKNKRRTKRTPK